MSLRNELQNADQEAHDWQDTQSSEDEEPQINGQRSGYILRCPWPGCECTSWTKYAISAHFLSVHLNCIWQCREKGCEYCGYLVPEHLERHRMSCHVGSPLQCGHHDCNQVFIRETWRSRGHTNYAALRDHFEIYFNQNLQSPRTQPSNTDSDLQYLSEVHELQKPLPSEAEYMERFTGRSFSYLSQDHRTYRLKQNYNLLAVHEIQCGDIEVRGSKTCTGFSYGDHHFQCADSVPLG